MSSKSRCLPDFESRSVALFAARTRGDKTAIAGAQLSDTARTRAEAQRLAILPHSFEDMDQNKDGVVDRAEYQRAFTH